MTRSAERDRIKAARFASAAAALAWFSVGSALADTANPGPASLPPLLSLNLSTGPTFDTNPDLSTSGAKGLAVFDTVFGLALNRSTRVSSLALSLGETLRFASGSPAKLRDPALSLEFKSDTGNDRINLATSYQQSPADLFLPTPVPAGQIATADLATGLGTMTSTEASLDVATGVKAPLGFILSVQYDRTTYSGTTDPDFIGSTTASLSAGTVLRMASGTEVSFGADAARTDYANATQTRQGNQNVNLGVSQALRSDQKLNLSLSWGKADASESGVITDQSIGLSGSIASEWTRPNGTISASLSSNRDALGSRQVLSVSRTATLPSGTLNATVGVSARSGTSAQPVGSLSYALTLPSGSVALGLSRQISLNADNVDEANSTLDLTLQHKINPVSSFGLSVDIATVDSAGGGAVAWENQQTYRATWSHDLAQSWQLTAGYQFRSLSGATTGAASSNLVFLTFSRKFTLLP